MTNEELDRLEELLKMATPGTWLESDDDIVYDDDHAICYGVQSDDDRCAIVDLHNAAPALIAAARENARLRAVVEAARKWATLRESDQSIGWLDNELAAENEVRVALYALDAKGGG